MRGQSVHYEDKLKKELIPVILGEIVLHSLEKMKIKRENRLNSYAHQKNRINKIGIENIRISKLARLEREHEQWMKEFQSNQKVIPGIKQLLTLRING